MPSNVRSFNLKVQQHADAIPARMEKLHRAVALEALRGVVLMSPVDTGRFRANWQTTVAAPAADVLDVAWPGNSAAAGAAAKQFALDSGARAIATIPAFSASWLVNNLPYAAALERGSSQQAPRGMLAVTAARLRAWLGRQK